jgi:hypothetical protein
MSLWFKNNKLIFDGGLVFCDECPCGGGEFPGCENLAEEYLIVAGTYIELRYHDGSSDANILFVERVELLEDCVVTRDEELECRWFGLGLTRITGIDGVSNDSDEHWNLSLEGTVEEWWVSAMTLSSITKPKGVGPAGQYAADESMGMFESVFGEGEVTEVAP